MRLLPAIDLKNGACVRLVEGRPETAQVYAADPGRQARAFREAGAVWVHLVDLDGAFEGTPVNREAVEAVLASGLRVQLGGGLRTLAAVDQAVGLGAERVVLGTAAVADPDLLRTACARHPGRVVVAVDARDGEVAVAGWVRGSGRSVDAVARDAREAGAAGLLFTDIARDGTGAGVNREATAALARTAGLPVVASGGIHGLADLEALAGHPGVDAAVAGRAVYEGTLDLPTALAAHHTSHLYPD